jgi:hypothetical protein
MLTKRKLILLSWIIMNWFKWINTSSKTFKKVLRMTIIQFKMWKNKIMKTSLK